MRLTAGILLYRVRKNKIEILLVRNASKTWGIPKGHLKPGEDLQSAARRETFEECRLEPDELEYVGYVTYGRPVKRLHCFAAQVGSKDEPEPCAEIMKAKFVELSRAKSLIQPAQIPFIEWIGASFMRA
jgi:ADP-ribose pyrophosphatase YjhB (NUDIX family)